MVYVLNLTPRHPRSVGSGKHNIDNNNDEEVSPRSTIDFDDYNHGKCIGCESCGVPDREESALLQVSVPVTAHARARSMMAMLVTMSYRVLAPRAASAKISAVVAFLVGRVPTSVTMSPAPAFFLPSFLSILLPSIVFVAAVLAAAEGVVATVILGFVSASTCVAPRRRCAAIDRVGRGCCAVVVIVNHIFLRC
eukprot:CAMPEP_0181136480 /NCGR_PEP_ID=MMETSP1071-20121207/33198_1 /TAXON_ID=35127 /ORGANISM="Thalassiosira sp., Strain NH16" /LENGTH=193 /DNA_ID=CAMNT_0023223177 /DNA_START=109 /DNA_END=687 /DNA_ORIENTATION=+